MRRTARPRRSGWNYVYDPVNAAKITAYVQYISPVKGVRDELVKARRRRCGARRQHHLFPDDEKKARLKVFASLDADTDVELTDAFLKATGG